MTPWRVGRITGACLARRPGSGHAPGPPPGPARAASLRVQLTRVGATAELAALTTPSNEYGSKLEVFRSERKG